MSKPLQPPAVYGINSAQRILGQGALVVRLEEYEQLQARIAELEAINLGLTKTLVEMEAENAELRERMREVKGLLGFYLYGGSNYRADAEKAVTIIDASLADDEGEA